MNMKRIVLCAIPILLFALPGNAQGPAIQFIADTLVVQADGTYETDPDLATMTFDVSCQDKEQQPTYQKASEAIQKITQLAGQNGIRKEDISSGVLRVTPYYEGGKKPKSFRVQGQIMLKVRDFSKLGIILEGSVTEGITDFRSITYSLADEEAAKQRAVADAMKRAVGRASAALEQKGQKIGALRFANVDVRQLTGVSQVTSVPLTTRNVTQTTANTAGVGTAIYNASSLGREGSGAAPQRQAPPPPPSPPPLPAPEKIKVSATIQCAFEIK
jgi:uncharacterized protein YggE